MSEQEINWYRVPIPRDVLRELTRRSDAKGLLQAVSHLLVVAATGTGVFLAYGRLSWPWVLLAFFIHGTVMSFMGGAGAFHELCHGTPFKTRWLNELFLGIFGFFSWSSFVHIRTSHMKHHQYTVFKEHDLEVILPGRIKWSDALLVAVHPPAVFHQLRTIVRHSLGILEGDWEKRIFSGDGARELPALKTWARVLILGHVVLAALCAWLGAWILIPIFLTPFYAAWLTYLCSQPQHFGLLPDSPDWRRSCRTVILGPIASYLYWRMNYHTEHHMYAAVPFHALRRLHQEIAHESPKPNRGMISAWREILGIWARLKTDPAYVFDQYTRQG